VVAAHAQALPPFSLQDDRAAIDRCFGADSVAGIFEDLAQEDSEWAVKTLATLGHMSPSSLRWSFDIIRAGADRNLEECLAAELALVQRVTRHPDFAEGVRAMVVDKDRSPKWGPLSLA
jgi:enoyl-CoA hydratase